ncbi:MAG TPA: DUF1887 family CARF protein [Verrucomicrobiota bacterium]|nr:DUF1887 family CARF protein [Verrucomicrobiota bacterium]HNT14586.1 DUF1887 family CARF protein [Verrucomicrobiota bacterium]
MKTQLCLLSGELMPNVIGILHERPELVIPIVTDQSSQQVKHLEAALRAAGCQARLQDPITVLPYDLADCGKTIGRATSSIDDLTINWTGGTKIMSYAARRIAETKPARAIYVNTADRQLLIEDNPQTGAVRSELLDSTRLGLNTLVHILAAGHKVERGSSLTEFRTAHTPATELQAAAEMIVDAPGFYWPELFKLSEAVDRPVIPRKLPPAFLQTLETAKIIQKSGQRGAYVLCGESLGRPFHRNSAQEENSKFIRGGYLEVFLWSQLKNRGAFDDVAWHVRLNPGPKGRSAELDVAVVSDGRFVVIESKGRIDLGDLANLIEEQNARTRRVGRLFGQWILYVHQFRAEFDAPNARAIIASQEERAKDFGGHLLWHDDLADFPVLVGGFLNEGKMAL